MAMPQWSKTTDPVNISLFGFKSNLNQHVCNKSYSSFSPFWKDGCTTDLVPASLWSRWPLKPPRDALGSALHKCVGGRNLWGLNHFSFWNHCHQISLTFRGKYVACVGWSSEHNDHSLKGNHHHTDESLLDGGLGPLTAGNQVWCFWHSCSAGHVEALHRQEPLNCYISEACVLHVC